MHTSPTARSSDVTPASLALGIAAGLVVVGVGTAVCALLLRQRLTDVVMVYLLGVVVVAMRFGYAPSLFTAAASVAAFDFFFVAPYYSFAVADKRYVVTFAIMLFVALVISDRTERIRRIAAAAREREVRTARLYAMSRELAVARSSDEVMRVGRRHFDEVFQSDVRLLVSDAGGVIQRTEAAEPEGEVDLMDTFASQIGLAMERARLGEDAQRAQLEVQNERLRNALLSSVSHDLRTPLAVIKGAVTALLDGDPNLTESRRAENLAAISDEASRMNRLVSNLLGMTSLEAGALRVRNKEWQPLEEVIGVALNRLDEQLDDRVVRVQIPPDASLVPFDATLIEQVFVNLVENAIKYTPPSTAISITARRMARGVEVVVADSGPGVPAGEEESIFEKFHRAARTEPGMGIGLTICRGIVVAHGGTIRYAPAEGGGASFRFVLPLDAAGPPESILPEMAGEP